MRFAGIDIGSRTIELVVVDASGEIKASPKIIGTLVPDNHNHF
jgi:predicted NBD/HSP70 family sugar kinase